MTIAIRSIMTLATAAVLAGALPRPGHGQAPPSGGPLPSTTLVCANFRKDPDGSWVVVDDKPFMIGGTLITIGNGTIVRPNSVQLEGQDFYTLLEATCGAGAPPRR